MELEEEGRGGHFGQVLCIQSCTHSLPCVLILMAKQSLSLYITFVLWRV